MLQSTKLWANAIQSMIKLQVNHNKHPKESGAKLEIAKKNEKSTLEKESLPPLEKQPKDKKKDQKDEKIKKTEKEDKKKDGKDVKKKDEKKKDEKKINEQSPPKPDKNSKNKKDDKKQDLKGANAKDKSQSLDSKNKDKEKETISNINKQEQKAKMTIQELIQYYKDQANDMFANHGHDPQKQKEIQKKLTLLQKQKQKRREKIESLNSKKIVQEQSKQNQQKQKIELKIQKQKQRKVKKIEKELTDLERIAKQRQEAHQKFLEYAEQKKKVKPRYKIYEQRLQESFEKDKKEYEEQIQEIKKKFEPMDKEELDNFDENYNHQRQQSIAYRKNKMKLQKQMLRQQNQRFKGIWKGKCHKNVQQEREELKSAKEEPKRKLMKLKEYGKQVHLELKKEISEKKSHANDDATSSKDSQTSDALIFRQKYLKGVNLGLVAQPKILPLSIEEKAQMGNEYLEMVHHLPKKRKNLSQSLTFARSQSEGEKKSPQTFKMQRKSNPYYSIEEKGKSIDFKNYESIEYSIQNIKSKGKDLNLHDQIIKYGEYSNVLEVQQKKRKVNHIMANQISKKLDLLKKL